MRIAFIGQKEFPATSRNVDRYIEELSLRLAERGHSVFSYVEESYNRKSVSEQGGVTFVSVPGFAWGKLKRINHLFCVAIMILFKRYDIVHFHGIEASLFGMLIKLLKRKTASIGTLYNRPYLEENRGGTMAALLSILENIFFSISERIITTSKSLKKYALTEYGRNIAHIPAGPSMYCTTHTKALDRWDLKERKYAILEARTDKENRVEKLIKTFRKIEDTNKIANGFRLLIWGDASLHEDQKKKLIASIGKRDTIIFTEKHSRSSIEQLLSHAYLFIQPFETDEIPMRLIEAMKCGAAPLVSDNHINREVIGKCGFTYNPRSSQQTEEILSSILNKPEEVKKMSRLASDRIQKEFSWESITRKTLRIYELAHEQKYSSKINALEKKVQSYV